MPPIDGPLTTPAGSVGCADTAATAQANTETTIAFLVIMASSFQAPASGFPPPACPSATNLPDWQPIAHGRSAIGQRRWEVLRCAAPMHSAVRLKLFLMMVLEFVIWGAWYPLIFSYLPSLGFTPAEQSWILSAFPAAAIVGMFFSNQF